jgi:hypothetical protein
MPVTLRIYPVFQALNDGVPIAGGRVYTYETGGAVTRAVTYADSRKTIPNRNPIILDSRGEARIFSSSIHYLEITDKDGTALYTEDNVAFGRDPVIPLTDEAGDELASGLLGTYTAGSSTERDTFYDPDELVTNANPVVADADGIARVYSGVGQNLKYVLKDSKSRLIWTLDDTPVGNRLSYFADNGGSLYLGGGYSYSIGAAAGSGYFYPDARSDDGYYDYRYSTFNSTQVWVLFGSPYHCFVRFKNVLIPQGATIVLAHVLIEDYYGSYLNDTNVDIYFEDADDPLAPTSGPDYLGRTLTGPIFWDVPQVEYQAVYTTPDLSSILQTVVNRSGFSSGNSVLLQMRDNGSSYYNNQNFRSIDSVLDGGGGNYAKLYVEWTT